MPSAICSQHDACCRYVRLELLEGIVAYHSGSKPMALQKLQSADAKWERLQVSDAHLASLAAAGFSTKEVTHGKKPRLKKPVVC